ncbi:MAG TPA: hypothetical protein PLF29_02645, partial [bacterium]|nr:hypothetical protein [bacterium]
SQCRGDIVGPYTGIMYAPEDPTHPKEISAATELAALTFRLPSQEAYRTGSMTFHDIDPQNLLSDYDKERYAMNSGGSGVTTLQNVSSYVKVPNSTSYSGMEAPELVDKGDDGTGTTPPPPGFDGKCNGSVFASTFLKNAPNLSPTTSDVPNVSPQVEGVYAALEDVTGLACEIFAGLHYNETGGTNAPNRSIISGRVLGENEPDVGKTYPPCEEGDTTFESCLPGLYESGVDAARIFIAHSGTSASNLDYYSSVRAFSRYTSPFYKNCGHKLTQYNDPYVVYPGFAQYCSDPLPYEGYDNLPLNLIDSEHSNMGLMSCGFHPDFGNYVDICPIEPEINYNNDPPTGPDGEDLIGPFDQWFRMGSATAAYRWYQAVTSSRAER